MSDDFELHREDTPMDVWVEDGCVVVEYPERGGTKHYSVEQAREVANAFEAYVESHGEERDELHQAAMLKRAAEQVDNTED